MPWSLSTPPDGTIEPRLSFALLLEVGTGRQSLARCTQMQAYWSPFADSFGDDHKCLFSRYFTTRDTDKSGQREAASQAQLFQDSDLDSVALFRDPKLVRLRYKLNTTRIRGEREQQEWVTEEACTNCLAAGIWFQCTHWVRGAAGDNGDEPFVDTPRGQPSTRDRECAGQEQLLKAIQKAQLITVYWPARTPAGYNQ